MGTLAWGCPRGVWGRQLLSGGGVIDWVGLNRKIYCLGCFLKFSNQMARIQGFYDWRVGSPRSLAAADY